MIEVDEMQQRMLAELEEAGEENIAAMINTVIDPVGDREEVDGLRDALEEMVRQGLVSMALASDPSRPLEHLSPERSLEIVSGTPSFLRFRVSDNHWTWASEARPHIVMTSAGREQANELLERRGYQWWRLKR